MMNQDLIKASEEKVKEVKELMTVIMDGLNLSPERLEQWTNLYSGSANELPTDKPFKFVSAKLVEVEDNTDMNHIVMVTDTGHECSLSSLTRLCLVGEAAKDPMFKPSKQSSKIKEFGVLRGTKSISPELTSWFNAQKVNRAQQAEALILSEKSFMATAVEVLTYFPNKESRNTVSTEGNAIAELNAQPASVRIAMCDPKDAYIVSFA